MQSLGGEGALQTHVEITQTYSSVRDPFESTDAYLVPNAASQARTEPDVKQLKCWHQVLIASNGQVTVKIKMTATMSS